MLRWLLVGTLIYGIGTGLKNEWIVINWSQFLHEVGFTSVDPEKPIDWFEFILERFETESNE